MATNSAMPTPSSTEGEQFLCDDWFDPLENGVRTRIRGFIEELLEAELDAALGRARYERPGAGGGDSPESFAGSRHGHRKRRILGTFGATTVRVPRDPRRQDDSPNSNHTQGRLDSLLSHRFQMFKKSQLLTRYTLKWYLKS